MPQVEWKGHKIGGKNFHRQSLYSGSSDVSRFEGDFVAIIQVPEYFGEMTNSKTK